MILIRNNQYCDTRKNEERRELLLKYHCKLWLRAGTSIIRHQQLTRHDIPHKLEQWLLVGPKSNS